MTEWIETNKGKIVPFTRINEEKYLNTYYIGMGEYFMTKKNYKEKVPSLFYSFNEVISNSDGIRCLVVPVEDIKEHIGAPVDISRTESIQLIIILGIVFLIIVSIIALTIYGYRSGKKLKLNSFD